MSRHVLQVFEQYQQARSSFVQTVAELAHRPQNIEALQVRRRHAHEVERTTKKEQRGEPWGRVGACL